MELVGKIVLTGGPCAGKTTALSKIEESLTEKGYKVLIVSESATELIKGGIMPFGKCAIDIVDFQILNIEYQLKKEATYEAAAKKLPGDGKAIIIYDRGAIDNKAYVTDEQFSDVLTKLNLCEIELMDRYDLVLHLVTAANGAEKFYTLSNNTARTETIEEAKQKDNDTLNAWIGHHRLKIIDNSQTFDDKINSVLEEVYQYIGNPIPIKKERKYLIDLSKSDLKFLDLKNCQKIDITQAYLISESGEKRIRKRTNKGANTYFTTYQKDTDHSGERVILEEKIKEDEYLILMGSLDEKCKIISKQRHSFTHQNQYFRLDIIPELGNYAILEIELTNRNSKVVIPNQLFSVKEVTDDINYRNYNLASSIKIDEQGNKKIKKVD